MAEELQGLGLVWEDEGAVRRNIAASMQAKASDDAIADQDRLAKAWAAVTNAEASLDSLSELPVPDRPADYATKLAAAERAVEHAGKVLKTTQRDVEKRAKERLEAARKDEAQREENRQRAAEARRALAMGQETATHLMIPSSYSPTPPSWSASPLGGGSTALPSSFPSSRSTSQDEFYQNRSLRHLTVPRPLATSTSSSSAVPSSRRGTKASPLVVTDAVDDYRGGALLPSVHAVTISKQDRDKYGRTTAVTSSGPVKRQREEEEEPTEVKREPTEGGAPRAAPQTERAADEEEDRTVHPVPHLPNYVLSETIYRRLLGYQKEGLYWLVELHHRRTGGILGDEMGLGKTVQIAVLLNTLLRSGQLRGPALIVAPLTVLSQWKRELAIWAPSLTSHILHNVTGSASVDETIELVRHKPVAIITTYTTMTLQIPKLQTVGPQYVILDEGHKISNPTSATTMAAKSFLTPHRLILSGSPIQNSLQELWCLFDFVVPQMLGTVGKFTDEFAAPINASKSHQATPFEVATAIECAKVLRAYIEPFLLRRLKRDVNAMLPQKHERVIRCSLTDTQLEGYVQVLSSETVRSLLGDASLKRFDTGYMNRDGRDSMGQLWSGPQAAGSKGVSHQQRQQAYKVLHSLRQLCNHADIFYLKQDDQRDGGTGKDVRFRSNRAVRYEGSSKLTALRSLLQQWRAGGHKVLIFSQYRMMLDIIENMCEQEQHTYIRMDGETASRDRGVLIDKFNKEDSIFVALLTTKVGGLGVNLTGADRVVLFDPDWNPATDEQARERAWRIGQRREVCIYRMIASGTIEETILHRQLAKTYVTEKVLSDPTLQRSFSSHSFIEAFFLGTEYANRVPSSKRNLISRVCDLAIAESEAEFQREVKHEEQLEQDAVKREQSVGHRVGATAEVLLHQRPVSAAAEPLYREEVLVAVKREDSTEQQAASDAGGDDEGELGGLVGLMDGRTSEAALYRQRSGSISAVTLHLARSSAQNVLTRAISK